MIEISGLTIRYPGRPPIPAGDLAVPERGAYLIAGENGTGKSSLIRAVLRIVDTFDGRVLIDGTDNREMSRLDIARKISYLPQISPVEPDVTVEEFVRQGLYAVQENRLAWVVKTLGLEDLLARNYTELSGGQKQLCRIARATSALTPYFFLDEPDAFLSKKNRVLFLDLAGHLSEVAAVVVVSHHEELPFEVIREFE